MTNFYDSQAICEFTFSKLRPCWHLFTPENCPIIFTTIEDYKIGVSLFGIAALICRNVKVITFELMSNHIHATICGTEESIREFFRLFRSLLNKYFKSKGGGSLPEQFDCSLRAIETLDDMRSVVVYNNRNGYLVHPEHSPYSYPYGANSYFFNPSAKDLYTCARTKFKMKDLEKLAHTHAVRDIQDQIYVVNGYISPLCFCDIETGEKLFRNAAHYFYCLSRNIESQKKIAGEIGDIVFYTDDELYSVASAIAAKKYGLSPTQIPKEAKIEIAKTLHFDYNASNKALTRMLKLDISLINTLFPPRS